MAILKFENIYISIKNIFSRFPISAFISIIATFIFLIYAKENLFIFENFEKNTFLKIWFTLIVSFFTSIGFYIFWESFGFTKAKKYFLQIFTILHWLLFFYFLNLNFENFESLFFLLINLVSSISFIFFAPFLKNIKQYQEKFYSYFVSILSIFLNSFLIWWVIFLLSWIWLFSLGHLFDLKIYYQYRFAFIISAFLIAPFFALNSIPKNKNFENWNFNENNFLLFFIKNIFIPAIFGYFIILYAYTIKVLLNFDSWPKWEISRLVIFFSIFWYFIYILSYVYEEKILYLKKIRKFFPLVVFPQIFMLFYAIFLRINQYWITINRYLVIIFWIYLFFITIYYIFSKKKFLSFIFISMFIFLNFFSIWPWSIFNFPKNNQTNILKQKLEKVGILKENWVLKALENNENMEKKFFEISEKIDYLCDFYNCEKLIFNLMKNNKDFLENNKNFANKYELKNNFKKYLNIDLNYEIKNASIKIFYFYSDNISPFFEIKWYNFLSKLSTVNFDNENKNFSLVNFSKKSLEIYENWEKIQEINIKNILENILEKIKNSKWESKNYMIFKIENEKIKIKILIDNLNIFVKNNEILEKYDFRKSDLEWYILYSKK